MNKYNLERAANFNKEIKQLLINNGYDITDLIGINVIISSKHNKPAIFLRRNSTDPSLIKQIIKSAYHNQPLIIMPQFSNTLQSLSTCVEKGILYKDNSGDFFFTF